MKRIFLLLAFACSLTCMKANAQENIIKTGITNAFFGDFNLSYERLITDVSSLHFKIGYFNPMASFTLSEKVITPDEYTFIKDKGGFHTSLEYRFYLSGEKTLQGFYLAPFLRHFNQKVHYTDMIDGDKFNVNARMLNFGLGAQMGYQLILAKGLTFDFYFLGLSLDRYAGKLEYKLAQPRSGFNYSSITDNIDQTLEDYHFIAKNTTHHVKTDRDDVKFPFFLPGIRIGVSAGYAF